MLIIAHRGASSDAPENTLAAFRLAWEQGADGVELDLRLSADRRLVVHHDADTRRTCGQRLRVAGTTSEKLATLDAGRWKAPRWTGERIPQLGGVLAEAPLGSCVMIEIKAGPEIVPVLADELGSLPADRLRLVVMAFDLGTVGAFKRAMPGLCCHLVVSSRRSGRWGGRPQVEEMIDRARQAGLDGLNVDARFRINPGFVSRVRAAGLGLHVWTVNDPARANELMQAGVDGITTDQPALVRAALGG